MSKRIAVVGSPSWRDVELGVETVNLLRSQGWGGQTLVSRKERGVETAFWGAWVRSGHYAEKGDPLEEIADGAIDCLFAFVHDRSDYAARCVIDATRIGWPYIGASHHLPGEWPIVSSPPLVVARDA